MTCSEFGVQQGESEFRVRLGDSLSPTLFGLFKNDLAHEINTSGHGIEITYNLKINALMYADNFAESEKDLQNMMYSLHYWYTK